MALIHTGMYGWKAGEIIGKASPSFKIEIADDNEIIVELTGRAGREDAPAAAFEKTVRDASEIAEDEELGEALHCVSLVVRGRDPGPAVRIYGGDYVDGLVGRPLDPFMTEKKRTLREELQKAEACRFVYDEEECMYVENPEMQERRDELAREIAEIEGRPLGG